MADANYQGFLRDKYHSLAALSQRWYQDDSTLKAWTDIKVPEPAYFLGWGPDAIDLAGIWKVSQEAADNPSAINADFDDSAWGQMVGPGDGLARNLKPTPALWRRHFQVDDAWVQKHPRVWLYVFDLNDTRGADTDASKAFALSLNGRKIPETSPLYDQDHRAGLEITGLLHAGDNFVAVRLPRAIFNYRVYLAGEEPKAYPALGQGRNA